MYEVTAGRDGWIMTTRLSWPLWRPPDEALETIAASIASHWNAAKAYRERLFWQGAESWLHMRLPLNQRRQAHQVGFRISVGTETKLGTTVIDEIELHVATSFDQ